MIPPPPTWLQEKVVSLEMSLSLWGEIIALTVVMTLIICGIAYFGFRGIVYTFKSFRDLFKS